jgi:hypothetical protein
VTTTDLFSTDAKGIGAVWADAKGIGVGAGTGAGAGTAVVKAATATTASCRFYEVSLQATSMAENHSNDFFGLDDWTTDNSYRNQQRHRVWLNLDCCRKKRWMLWRVLGSLIAIFWIACRRN